jgi:hypothetical protein
MSTETKNQAPLQKFQNGSVFIKIWEQNGPNGRFPTASVENIFQDKQTGEFRKSMSFGEHDLLKLQALIPEAHQELRKWRDYYREVDRQPESAPEKPPVRDLAAERDAVMQAAKTPAPDNTRTQEYAPQQDREPAR